MLIMHSSMDNIVPFNQSVLLYEKLRACGKEAVFYRLEGAGHGTGGFTSEEAIRTVFAWVKGRMQGPSHSRRDSREWGAWRRILSLYKKQRRLNQSPLFLSFQAVKIRRTERPPSLQREFGLALIAEMAVGLLLGLADGTNDQSVVSRQGSDRTVCPAGCLCPGLTLLLLFRFRVHVLCLLVLIRSSAFPVCRRKTDEKSVTSSKYIINNREAYCKAERDKGEKIYDFNRFCLSGMHARISSRPFDDMELQIRKIKVQMADGRR
jgi:hypothetical protein